ncbi:MAG: 30S ribosomal protein S6 [candidate division WOR-3 bacterium]
MKDYEAVFILTPKLSKETVQKLANELKKNIETAQGEKIIEEKIEKRPLQYPIKKHKEGIYLIYKFSAPPTAITKIKEAYKHNESVLRYSILAIDRQQAVAGAEAEKEK